MRELMDMRFASEAPATEGYVYVIRDPSTGLIKIGRSIDPWERLERLSREMGNELDLVDYWFTGDCVLAESVAHRKFANSRVHGEWFCLGAHFAAVKVEEIVLALDPGRCDLSRAHE